MTADSLVLVPREVTEGGKFLPYPYRMWMLALNPLWWISPETEPRWHRAEFRRRARAIIAMLEALGHE